MVSAYLTQLAPDAPAVVEGLLTGAATVGEFWIIGYLLIFGMWTVDRPLPRAFRSDDEGRRVLAVSVTGLIRSEAVRTALVAVGCPLQPSTPRR